MKLNNIEMMNKLMEQAKDLRVQQVNANHKTKQEMIAEAKKKIRDYFDEVLRVIPFQSMNIKVGEDFQFFIRKDESLKAESGSYSKKIAFEKPEIVIVKRGDSYSSNYYTIQDEFANTYWNSSRLSELSTGIVLSLVSNFDLVKSTVEQQIASSIEKKIQKDSEWIQKDVMEMETLENFLK